jgi:hypothetical protein
MTDVYKIGISIALANGVSPVLVAHELFAALKPAMDAGVADAKTLIDENRGLIAHIFGLACERHQVGTEAAAARILSYIGPALADMKRRTDHLGRQFEQLACEIEATAATPRVLN